MANKEWKIIDGKIPDDAMAFMEDGIAKANAAWDKRVNEGTIIPPWCEIPGYGHTSMCWRMGGGEDYMRNFRAWFSQLETNDRIQFETKFPEPQDWSGFYKSIETGS
ncbi:hypothetical protein [Leisingera sp. ANG-DT]|uniref:hypothetical protein n=1 Tax=Leisingera sp. ANG-DT TaxID=1577897 RepID=UPI00068C6169|nr:hypothetical protein [Leisingera sp. ANG-DT]